LRPLPGGVPPLAGQELEALAKQVPQWRVISDHHITRAFTFPDFKQALAFVNRVGNLAEWVGGQLAPLALQNKKPVSDDRAFVWLPFGLAELRGAHH
jgi:hypothetical protein